MLFLTFDLLFVIRMPTIFTYSDIKDHNMLKNENWKVCNNKVLFLDFLNNINNIIFLLVFRILK